MYIHEAVERALKENCSIAHLNTDGKLSFKIKPTEKYPNYLVIARAFKGNKELIFEKWFPTTYDLTRNDWELIDNDLEHLEEQLKEEWWEI